MVSDFKFLIDWNNDGDFSDANEDVTEFVQNASWSLGFSEPYQHVAGETRLDLRLRNTDKRFSPENESSPMAGSMLPQRLVKIQNTASGTVDMYLGYIESINPVPGERNELSTQIVGVGVKQFLQRQEYYSPFFEGVTSDTVIEDILINTSLPPTFGNSLIIDLVGHNLIDTHYITTSSSILDSEVGKTTFDFVGDTWEDGVSAVQAISDLVNSDRGWFFQSREGSAVYWNRHHLMSNDTLLGTVDNTWADMDYRYGMADIINIVRVGNYPRSISAGSAETLWELEKNRAVQADGTVVFRARYREQDSDAQVAGRNVTEPNLGDSSLVIDPVGASHVFSVDESNARSMKISIVNDGNKELDVTTLIVKGQKVTTYNREEVEAVDSVSLVLYGKQVMTINNRLLDDEAYAANLGNYELAQRKDARGVVRSIGINRRNSANEDMMINRSIGDWIQVVDDQTDHDGEYIIMGERHRWEDGDWHTVDYILQPGDTQNYIFIDETGKNVIDSGRFITL